MIQPAFFKALYNFERVSSLCVTRAIVCVCVCVCVYAALVIQHAKRMRHIILSSVACWLYNISPHYLTNGKTFGEKNILKCVF